MGVIAVAGEEYLGLLGNNDLMQFTNTVMQSDPRNIASRSLMGWTPDYSTWSPAATGATAFGKAFLSGMLSNYANQNAANQTNALIGVLPQLAKNPISVQAPEGVDAAPFATFKASSILKNIQRRAATGEENNKTISQLIGSVLGKAVDNEQVSPRDAIEALESGDYSRIMDGKLDPLQNPESRQYKANKDKFDTLDTLRDKFNKLPEVVSFSQVQRAANAMAGALKDKGGPSDLELVRYAVQMIEPGMAVREGEQQAVLKSGSIPDQWKGELNKSLENGTAISDTVRAGLKRLAARAYEAQKQGYDKAVTYYQGIGEGRDLLGPGESISYLGVAPDSASIFGPTIDARTFAQQALAKGMTKDEARAAWIAQGGQ